ncbi:uncharacterized protein Z520_06466 [Fonsecaea multimorphosa CBS 102226]|uniref:Uncharacterized protein n=1 Tax=Fonsecaea multimorphosa CBS 102226 TaxID=1442371 RepID=A0A0D2KLW2_9EURO|nr:uncharacterized protein Z520_06466 [Fonsecaea multimorphosa CBS 102226]KIX97688.1 hypothetical protein Z520_06466 [Fonsecaea multimorphosa CBS 102226]OAL24006.1 hypothetical protein AYO22_06030 [Fonsecaea multimorphosa]
MSFLRKKKPSQQSAAPSTHPSIPANAVLGQTAPRRQGVTRQLHPPAQDAQPGHPEPSDTATPGQQQQPAAHPGQEIPDYEENEPNAVLGQAAPRMQGVTRQRHATVQDAQAALDDHASLAAEHEHGATDQDAHAQAAGHGDEDSEEWEEGEEEEEDQDDDWHGELDYPPDEEGEYEHYPEDEGEGVGIAY